MKWTEDRSIALSQICLGIFAFLLAALDMGCYWAVGWFISLRGMPWQSGLGLMAVIYLCSVFGWLLLHRLWGLLKSMKMGQVFTEENVRRLRWVSWCCAGAAAVCLLGCTFYLPLLFLAMAAGFMALIVRIVKNVFRQAGSMKAELDFTV